MALIVDILLGAGALGSGYFCFVLSQRLVALNRLESGMGGAIAVLSAQVDDMTKAIKAAEQTAAKSAGSLDALTGRAEEAAQRLELMLASLHDLPDAERPQRRQRVIHRRMRSGETAGVA